MLCFCDVVEQRVAMCAIPTVKDDAARRPALTTITLLKLWSGVWHLYTLITIDRAYEIVTKTQRGASSESS